MKTNVLYFLAIVFFALGCSAKKNIRVKKRYDEKHRLTCKREIYKWKTYNWLHPKEVEKEGMDTIHYCYFYNADNTLDREVMYPQGYYEIYDGEVFISKYTSKYFYRFDEQRQQAEIVGVFYENCSDYPVKFRRIYNTKAQLLEQWYWEVKGGHIDTICSTRIKGYYDVFDTAYSSVCQTIQHKSVLEYNKEGKLEKVFYSHFHSYKNPGIEDMDLDRFNTSYRNEPRMALPNFFCRSEKEEDELTIIPYLKSLGKLK